MMGLPMSDAEAENIELEKTSLALLLVPLFRRLADVNAGDLPASTIEARLRIMFDVPPDDSIYSLMSIISDAIRKLENQIQSISQEYPVFTQHASNAVNAVKRCVDPDSLIRDVRHINQFVTNSNLQFIESIGDILRSKNPTILMPQEVIPKILGQIDEIDGLIRDAGFGGISEKALLAQSAKFRWAVSNWHLLGGDAVFNASGGMLSVLRNVEKSEPAVLSEGESKKRTAYQRALEITDWAGRIALAWDLADTSVKLLSASVVKQITYAPAIAGP